MLLYMVAIIA